MTMQPAAVFFADRLSRERELTSEETTKLCAALAGSKGRRMWTAKEDRQVNRMKARGMGAPAIAQELGRTAWSVRFRLARLRAKAQVSDGQAD